MATDNQLGEFWESSFKDKQLMWGEVPTNSAKVAADEFAKDRIKNVLIPGIGYGRNAKPFLEKGMEVSGIEISATALQLNKQLLGSKLKELFLGSTDEMPFSTGTYGGIFCYSLIHLLEEKARTRLIQNCYNQLSSGGQMVFVMVSKNFPSFGKGKQLGKNTFETAPGLQLYFYDKASILKDFEKYGLTTIREIAEGKNAKDSSLAPEYWYINCTK